MYNKPVRLTFNEDHFLTDYNGVDAVVTYKNTARAIVGRNTILVYPQGGGGHLIPRSGIEEPGGFERLAEFLKTKMSCQTLP